MKQTIFPCKSEVWYWSETDQIYEAVILRNGALLMFFAPHRYYFRPWSRAVAKKMDAELGRTFIDYNRGGEIRRWPEEQ